jgi:hemoglobin
MIDFKWLNTVAAGALALSLLSTGTAKSGSLYDDLGQKPGITKVVADLVGFVADDGRIAHFFVPAFAPDLPRFEGVLVDQICYASGGPCTYTGKSMPEAHKGMNIREADFNALVEDLEKAMDKNHVPVTTQNRLLAVLAPLQDSVDEK